MKTRTAIGPDSPSPRATKVPSDSTTVTTAPGSTRGSVIEMVLGQAVWLAGAGVAVGAAAAWYLTSTVQSFLFELEAGDLRAFAAAAAALLIAALVASAIPARRAASVDPTEALRSD